MIATSTDSHGLAYRLGRAARDVPVPARWLLLAVIVLGIFSLGISPHRGHVVVVETSPATNLPLPVVQPVESATVTATPTEATPSSKSSTNLGFDPAKACLYMTLFGMPPSGNGYESFSSNFPDDYSCGSAYSQLGTGSGGLPNNISYYARGTRTSVKRLRILLNVNKRSEFKSANGYFRKAAQHLYQVSLGSPIPDKVDKNLLGSKPGRWNQNGYVVELQKDVWTTGLGFELNFIIRDPEFNESL
jgi:hypothetical protein